MNDRKEHLMTQYVTSADGTAIAFDRLGDGPPLVIVSGLLCDRRRTRALAEELARRSAVVNYDRRGRGDSGDTPPYAVEREIEDLAALISEAGGTASLYGHSSGAGLALHAAASGLPIERLVLHEPPYGDDDAASRRAARELAEQVADALAEGRGAAAIELFMTASGLPPELAVEIADDPRMQALAATMPHDFAVMGDRERGGAIPRELVRSVRVPTLVLAGGASPAFFRTTAERIAALLPDARHELLDGHDHGAPAHAVAPAVAAFLARQPLASPAANRSASP